MNNRKSLIFVLPLIAMVLMACRAGNVSLNREMVRGSGNVETETRAVSGIDRVMLSAVGDMTIIQGSEEGLTIEAEDNILDLIETEMRGNELVIRMKNDVSVNPTRPVRYTLKVKTLNGVAVSGAGNVTSESLEAKDLALEITGAGNISVDQLTAQDVSARTSGAGNYDLTGSTNELTVNITGSGNFDGGDLKTSKAKVTISGSGDVTVWVEDELDVRITGFGNVRYYGQPKVTQTISGSGEIKSLGAK